MSLRRPVPPIALTIAGSDSGGGAGIQADLRSFAAFGVHGATAITAVTAQNTRAVTAIQMQPVRCIRAQIDAVFDDFRVGAVKTGMLGTARVVRAVAAGLAARRHVPLVVDPVLVATSGAALARDGLVEAMRRHLLPRADLVTPNLPEAEQLLGQRIRTRADLLDAALRLRELGARAVLLKGGHLAGRSVHDVLVDDAGAHWFSHPRLAGEAHGTGCTLAASIVAGLARGESLVDAVRVAIEFVHAALERGYRPGHAPLRVLDHLGARPEAAGSQASLRREGARSGHR
ncbi:MAG: bifunctional hydroxymethylpyrimidine kinase/phosphomethylpyrimidine kinase [Xanthomonadales bacterium]|nr:bifunctional hydroxymethylpyrimidine kinase/phosphomethylpyrimidine kinase [Xanthomonadales bacterium]